jgi:hypothetical protein
MLLIFCEGEGEFSPAIVWTCSDVEHPVSGFDDFMVVLDLVEGGCIGVFEFFVSLSEREVTYFLAMRSTSSSYDFERMSEGFIFEARRWSCRRVVANI